jgi:hypothetical protein
MTEELAKAKQLAIAFATEFAYYRTIPNSSNMDVPSMAYEYVEHKFDDWIVEHEKNPSCAVNPFKTV